MKKVVKSIWVNKNLIKIIVSVILVLFCSIQPFNAEASENNNEPLNVGWYNWELPKDKFVDEAYQNYIKGYCKRLEEVTGLKLNYLGEKSFNNKNIFEDVNEDIVFGVPYSKEIAKKYAYIDSSVFDARFSLYRLRNKNKSLEETQDKIENNALKKCDYSYLNLKNKKIAVINDSRKNALKMIEDKTGVKVKYSNLIKYNTIKEAQEAVTTNKADYLFSLAVFVNPTIFKEACPLLENKTYLLIKPNNENLIEKLTYGLQVIKNENSHYNNWLLKKVKGNEGDEICFTSAEQKALNSVDKLTFYVNKNKSIYYNKDKNGIESGYYNSVIKNIAKRLNKDYQIIQVDPFKVNEEKTPGLFCDVVRNYKIAEDIFKSKGLTKPTLSTDVLLCIDKNSEIIKPGMIYAGDIKTSLMELTNDKNKIIVTKNAFEALELLIEHKADVAVVSSMLTNYVNGLTINKNIVIASIRPKLIKSMVAVNGLDENLLSAIDKAIYFINYDDMKLYIEQENEIHNYIPSIIEQINLNFNLFLVVVFLVFVLIIYIITRLAKSNLKIANLTNKIEEENKIKDQFLSRVSHDIRNPLNVVINYAKFGTEENKNGSVNHDYFEKIIVNAENLLSFMKNILELQRINNEIEIQKHVISFYELEKEVKNNYEDIAKAKGIDFETTLKCEEKAVYVRGNLKLIKQILFNLLNNSFKYTHVGGRVSLTMEIALKRGFIEEKYIISDNGIGISKEFQKKMYEPFNVGNEEVSAESKMGIGLSICKKTIEKLNGKIKCESEVSNGTIFTVTIKEEIPNKKEIEEYLARKNDEEKFKKVRKNKPKDSRFKILVCEDSIINAKILKKILENAKYKFEWAKNGEVAVSRAKDTNFDLILMDFKMPIMSGFEASESIRKFNKVIPIIGLSASSSEEYEKAFRAGMNECLEKPIDKNKLLLVIKKFTS